MITRFDGVSLWSSDLQNLIPFYRDIIGLPVALENPRFVIFGDLESPRLCIGSHSEVRGGTTDPHRWLVQLQSDDIHADVARLKRADVPFVEEPNEQSGGGFWLATCKDPEGNLVQLNYWEPGVRERVTEHVESSRSAAPEPRNGERHIRNSSSSIRRMDNVDIVVDDLKTTIAFFEELGLELEGEMTVEGPWVDRTVGLEGVRNDIAMLRTPDGHSRLELIKFHTPPATASEPNAPVNRLGIRRIMFAVEAVEDVVARLQSQGAKLMGELTQYEDKYRLCYVRGPEGIIVALAEQLN
jgi:predicted enzyme related to lactoylglutathione lyase